MASRKDYYDILGVRRGATDEEIEKAYRKLARTYQVLPHPGHRTADFRFKEILEAYEILSNKTRRERYDQTGVEPPPGDFDWEEAEEEEDDGLEGFEDVFDRLEAGEQRPKTRHRGKDLRCTLEIDFFGAVRGTEKEVRIQEEVPCGTCSGTGVNSKAPQRICPQCGGAGQVQIGIPPAAFSQECSRCLGSGRIPAQRCRACAGKGWVGRKRSVSVQIPAGAGNGCLLYLLRLGQAGQNGGPRGDLIAEVKVRKHPYFQRKGDDLYIHVPLTVWEAALGTELEVPALEGSLAVKIPPGTQPGDELRFPGKGLPFLEGGGQGDQVVALRVVIPRKLDERSRKAFEELKRKRGSNPRRPFGWRSK